MQITLNDFLRLLNNSDRLRIVKGGETKYVGYLGNFKQDNAELTGAEEVEKFRAVPEITHKQWKGRKKQTKGITIDGKFKIKSKGQKKK